MSGAQQRSPMGVRSAVQNQTMAQLGDDDFDESIETFWRLFAANLGEIAKQKTITLGFPRVEFAGGSAAGYDLDITGWRGSIAMYVEADGVAEETSLEIGFLELFTLPLNANTAESLDGVSADTAEYLELLSHGDLSNAVNEQFDYPIVSGLVILDRAYVHPTLQPGWWPPPLNSMPRRSTVRATPPNTNKFGQIGDWPTSICPPTTNTGRQRSTPSGRLPGTVDTVPSGWLIC
jgi:hypothetical protein